MASINVELSKEATEFLDRVQEWLVKMEKKRGADYNIKTDVAIRAERWFEWKLSTLI